LPEDSRKKAPRAKLLHHISIPPAADCLDFRFNNVNRSANFSLFVFRILTTFIRCCGYWAAKVLVCHADDLYAKNYIRRIESG
jgi:hypothetical protein